jgi:lactate dehydrogenase-like 2-hydroxyacid dehydrogenase
LRVVANAAVGYDNVDVDAAARLGIVVCNTPAVLDETTADLAFALILAASRRVSHAEADLRAGRWPGWGITQYLGRDVYGAMLGLVGYGRIGKAVARRATGFGMEVVHYARRDTGERDFCANLDDLLRRADIVSIHCTFDESTRGLIGDRELALLRPSAVLVNTARGEIVDEAALLRALEDGRLAGAALDTLAGERPDGSHLRDNPLVRYAREHENLIVLPHLGGATVEATERTQLHIAKRLAAFLS